MPPNLVEVFSLEPKTLLLGLAALLTGFVDAIVGGGGLIQLPALLLGLPGQPLATVLGTSKTAGVAGTALALRRYLRDPATRQAVRWRTVGAMALAAGAGAWLGARSVSALPKDAVRPLVLGLLVVMGVYTLWRRDFGQQARPRSFGPGREPWVGAALGLALGFYDGFFGPGMGSLLLFVFVGGFGYDFLAASASAKLVNVVTNVVALTYFVLHGHVLYALALPMAALNMAGAWLGTRLALRRGTGFVRGLFLVVLGAFILKLGWELVRG